MPIGSSALLGLALALANPSAVARAARALLSIEEPSLVGSRPLHNTVNVLLRLGNTKHLVMLELEGSTMMLCKELGFVVEGGQLDIAPFATSRVKAEVHHYVPVLAVVARIDFTHSRIVLDAGCSVHPRGSAVGATR